MLLSNDKEGLRNPLVPPEYEFSILTAPQEVMSGYFQEELCRNDGEWSSGDKTCNDILNKDDCSLVGLNGVSANDACLIACDTCPSSVTINQRQDVGDEFSVRGINIEDSDEYDYLEIYDKLKRADDDIEIIFNIFDELRSYQDDHLDMDNCKSCFYSEEMDVDTLIGQTQDGFLEACPPVCQTFATCYLNNDITSINCSISPEPASSPGSGVPGSGVPGSGVPGTGVPGTGVPGSGVPGTGVPGTGVPGTGVPGTGVPGSGVPGPPDNQGDSVIS